ncbi:MAG: orotidine-5'-phosphate decarboxylase [Flavobacteriales bacterium]|jgi:orotidine-5'-phosphate decarboxylase|nr:orotidine-5'-phosphate decarboxylase [Flavobacteriales bacterium]
MNYAQLVSQIKQKKSFLCVGLDPDINKIPQHLLSSQDPLYEFSREIVDATAAYAVAYKPNIAFYEAQGWKGMLSFEKTIEYIRRNYPDIFIIADAKRGDIGNTSAMYARTFFQTMDCDAVTVAPYMGSDSVRPFLEFDGKWVILLALTSNAGAADFQFTESTDGTLLYEKVIKTSQEWASHEQLMYVTGATKAEYFTRIRELAPRHFLLVPGVGAQGGSLEDVCRYGLTEDCGLLINSSRGIIYASHGEDYASVAGDEARKIQTQMEKILTDSHII